MARIALVDKAKRQSKRVEQYAARRSEWKELAFSSDADPAQRRAAIKKLVKTRRWSSVRERRRCERNGRPRGNLRRFKMCRNEVRLNLMAGMFPGARKASW